MYAWLKYLFENYTAEFENGINFVETFKKMSHQTTSIVFLEEVLIIQYHFN